MSRSSLQRRSRTPLRWIWIIALIAFPAGALAATADECLDCHGSEGLERASGKDAAGLLVSPEKFKGSIHGKMTCDNCHKDAVLIDSEHKPELKDVDCGQCHKDQLKVYMASLHGDAVKKGDPLAPRCEDCHSKHEVYPPESPNSTTYKFNIPATCSRCHKDGTEVTLTRKLDETHEVENYTESIHGLGLFKRGLTVTAVCTNCHGDHNILPHENPASMINADQVAKTCMQCHGEIARVHQKVIKGETWEKPNHQIPNCAECHEPHKIRRVQYSGVFSDSSCLTCHGKDAPTTPVRKRDGAKLTLDAEHLLDSAHGKLSCVKCHTGATTVDNPPCLHTGKVDCANCHQEQATLFAGSAHGKLERQGNKLAPTCISCHGTHLTKPKKDPQSPTHPANVPKLCSTCHDKGSKAETLSKGKQTNIGTNYAMSVHGKALSDSGLLVTATCISCHTSHGELPVKDPKSSVHPDNLPKTCGACHDGMYKQFEQSIHSRKVSKSRDKLPSCEDCHDSHTITRTDQSSFRQKISRQCGNCHKAVTESYFESYHGKITMLGSSAAAKCSDCHGAHNILPASMHGSTISRDNVVATCGKCHESSHTQFTGYQTHATHKDKDKYPAVFYSFWAMTLLLLGTIGFFSLHTLLWLPRSIKELKHKRAAHKSEVGTEKWIRRFLPWHRITHVFVILSFLTLATTGMALKFSYTGWAQILANLLGGFESAGTLHRFAAVITFGYFSSHLFFLVKERARQKKSWFAFITQKEGMLPNLRDLFEFIATVKWFVGKGPRPDYGRWTYWEKFDYFAVFWGVAMIGASGLILWFPEFFTLVIPGGAVNVATIIHSDEALLAAGFIFTIHFFNTHFRPDKFPMDPVIFTGAMRLEEFKVERPREYRELEAAGKIDEMLVPPPQRSFSRTVFIFGMTALTIGLVLVALIAWSILVLQSH